MMITIEQARLAVEPGCGGTLCRTAAGDVSRELIERAVAVAIAAPDVRLDRVSQAASRMAAGGLDSHQLAEKMLCRIASDLAF